MSWFANLSRNAQIALIAVVAIALFGCCALVGGYSYVNEARNSGIAYERQLSVQCLDNQNYLSAYVSGFYEQVSVAQAQSDVLDSILLDAVKGRYDKGGFAVDSPMFAVIAEAYPEAGVAELMANWGKIQDYISAGREGYRATQSKLLDQLRTYDTWRRTGIFKSTVVRMLGFPSNDLEARVGEMIFTGEAARNKMYQIVLTSEAIEAYEKGIMEPLQVPQQGQ